MAASTRAETSPQYNFTLFYSIIKWRSRTILRSATETEMKLFRTLEKSLKQVHKLSLDIEFNQLCLINRLLPKYSQLRLHDEGAQRDQETTGFRQHLVKRQVTQLEEQLRVKRKTFVKLLFDFIKFYLSPMRLFSFLFCLFRLCDQYACIEKFRHSKKLSKLYGDKILHKQNFNQVINCSNYEPNADELDVLNLGLNFSVKH